jgi:hypothetical protein
MPRLQDPGVEETILETKKEDQIRYLEFLAWAYQRICRIFRRQVKGASIAA